jgi:hypothetical protein
MTNQKPLRNPGGVAPFGYRWKGGQLAVDGEEAPIRRLIYDLFLKHKRKKTVARLLNDLGYRTRSGALFSDTTLDRLLRDTTAKGIRTVDGKEVTIEPIVDNDVWERANNILGGPKSTKQAVQLFIGMVFCSCSGKMIVPSNSSKYVCPACRHKIPTDDLEEIFASQLSEVQFEVDSKRIGLSDHWDSLTSKEKRIVVEQMCSRIVAGPREIEIEFAYSPHSSKTATNWQHPIGSDGTVSEPSGLPVGAPSVNEPLLSEAKAAEFLGISKMTLLRKRNAGLVGFFRVGFRILYSKEKHLLPYLASCEGRL